MKIGPNGYLDECVETLYVSEDYKLFLLTGQPMQGARRAYISAKPFNAFDPKTLARMKEQAEPLPKDNKRRISITQAGTNLTLRDGLTGTVTNFPVGSLDDDVKEKLGVTPRRTGGEPGGWGKYEGRKTDEEKLRYIKKRKSGVKIGL